MTTCEHCGKGGLAQSGESMLAWAVGMRQECDKLKDALLSR